MFLFKVKHIYWDMLTHFKGNSLELYMCFSSNEKVECYYIKRIQTEFTSKWYIESNQQF